MTFYFFVYNIKYNINKTTMKHLTQITTYHDQNKTIIKEIYFEDEQGLKQGSFKWFFESGNIKAEATFKDDERDGVFKYYYENRNIKAEGTFKNGSLIEVKTF